MLNLLVGQSWSASGHSDLMVSFRAVLVSLVISVICLSVYYIANFYLQVYKLPPGPLPLPYFGNVFRLTRGRSIHRVFLDLSKEYGKLFTFWIGGVAFINIGDTHIANEAFIKKMADFAGRPFIPGTEGMLNDKGADITFTDYGRAWEVLRRATFSAIRRHSVSEHFASTVTEAVDEAFDEFHNKYGDQPFSATDFLYLMTYNIMGQSILNRRFVSSNETYQRLAAGSRRATKALWKLPVVQCVPWLKHIPGFKQDYDAIMRHQRFQRHLCEVAIEEHIASYQDGHIRDLTDALLASGKEAETEAPETAGHFSATNMAGVMIDMFFAGSDSNRQSMHWAILFLCTFQNVQARVRREVEDVIGDKDVSAQACAELNYTKSFVAESLRYRNINPLGVPHLATVDTTLAGYPVTKGTCVFLYQHGIMSDSDHWREPDQFQPERFLDSNGQHMCHVASFVPFSTGRRMCVGEKLVLAEMLFWLVRLVQRTRGHRIELEHGPGSVSLDGDANVNNVLIPAEFNILLKKTN